MTQTNETINGEQRGVTGAIKAKAAGIVEDIKEIGKEQIDTKKQATADQVGKIAGAIERATEELNRSDFPSIAAYANQISTRIKNFANGLRDRNVEELLEDVRQAARRNPKMFLIGSIAAGIALSRFLKATEGYDSKAARGESWNSWESNWGTNRWEDKTRFEDERMQSTPAGNAGVSIPTSGPTPSKGV